MFRSAYVKLTAFYVGTIFFISVIFSLWVYHEATRELEEGLTARDRFVIQQQLGESTIPSASDSFLHDRLEEGKARVVINLVYFNLILLGVGGVLSYWLARKTMQPIEEAMQAQHRFTADASHELRTPLTAMKMELEVALRDKKRTKQETESLLVSNLEEVNRLVDLSEALLSLARDNDELTYEKVSMYELAEALVKRFSSLAAQKEIIIKNTVQNPKEIMTHKTSVEQILAILLDNALKYSPRNSTVILGAKEQKRQLRVFVKDEGPGISAADKNRIFKRFYRVDASRSEQHVKGNGLGLSIAKKRASRIGASISVKTGRQKGSVFTVSLPY